MISLHLRRIRRLPFRLSVFKFQGERFTYRTFLTIEPDSLSEGHIMEFQLHAQPLNEENPV